jgi:hypothetical protein
MDRQNVVSTSLLSDCNQQVLGDFAAFGPIKENPNRKIIAEVFKTVFDASGREQNIVRRKWLSRAAADKVTAALGDDVKFILGMRSLGIAATRRVKLHDQRAVLEQSD